MNTINYYEPEIPQPLTAPWLQLACKDRLYSPHLVRIRKRIFSIEMIRSLDLKQHAHSHRIYHLIFYLDGRNTIRIEGQWVEVRAGQMVLINPDVDHNVVPQELHKCSFLTLMFSYQSGDRYLSLPFDQLLGKLLGTQLHLPLVVEDINGSFHSFFSCLENDVLLKKEKDMERIGFCLAGLFNALHGTCLHRSQASAIPDDMLAVQQHLLENLDQPVTIHDLTRISNLSRSRLIGKFKQHCGMSPIDFLIHERIEKARIYLQHSSKRIKEIAWLCGFESEYYFCKTFKKRAGQTPGGFRRNKMGIDDVP